MNKLFILLLLFSSIYSNNRYIKLYNIHTGEKLETIYYKNGKYINSELKKINYILRDYRKNITKNIDKKLIDSLYTIYNKSNSKDYIEIISGYRSIETNNNLRKHSNKVAKNSYHTKGMAIDFRIQNYPLNKLLKLSKKYNKGGVGYYPQKWNRFIHIDSGRKRYW